MSEKAKQFLNNFKVGEIIDRTFYQEDLELYIVLENYGYIKYYFPGPSGGLIRVERLC